MDEEKLNSNQDNEQLAQDKQPVGEISPKKDFGFGSYKWWLIAVLVIVILIIILLVFSFYKNEQAVDLDSGLSGEFQGYLGLELLQDEIKTGDKFGVEVVLGTGGYNVAAASAYLKYDPNILMTDRIDSSCSVMSIGVEESMDEGIIKITRGEPGDEDCEDNDDGYNGDNGCLARVYFTAKQAGEFMVEFDRGKSTSVLDNGKGTKMKMAFKDIDYKVE